MCLYSCGTHQATRIAPNIMGVVKPRKIGEA